MLKDPEARDGLTLSKVNEEGVVGFSDLGYGGAVGYDGFNGFDGVDGGFDGVDGCSDGFVGLGGTKDVDGPGFGRLGGLKDLGVRSKYE